LGLTYLPPRVLVGLEPRGSWAIIRNHNNDFIRVPQPSSHDVDFRRTHYHRYGFRQSTQPPRLYGLLHRPNLRLIPERRLPELRIRSQSTWESRRSARMYITGLRRSHHAWRSYQQLGGKVAAPFQLCSRSLCSESCGAALYGDSGRTGRQRDQVRTERWKCSR
jgi:hypothetical protein